MKLPYGISDFRALREQEYLYIDKTQYIKKLESLNSKYVFFIRPRRFGKSLFLSTLEHYYDINTESDFDRLFGDLYIGQNPTPLKNSYFMLQLDFSSLNTKDRDELEKDFRDRINDAITTFLNKYETYFKDTSILKEKIRDKATTGSVLNSLIEVVRLSGKKMYLIIDEYDHFANDIIAMGENELYKGIIRSTGFVRDFYEAVKIGAKSVIDRIFITGASPVMLDDLTSGFNIAENITLEEYLNEMLGFTQSELEYIIEKLGLSGESLGINLAEYYNGYLFNANCDQRVYNPDMVLYYFNKFMRTKKPPEELIDINVRTDYGKIKRLVRNEENRKTLEQIIKDEYIEANIATEFSFDRMYDSKYFVSLLFYMGMLTIDRKELTRLVLKIPNYIIKTIYWGYIEERLTEVYSIMPNVSELGRAVEAMAFQGKIRPYIDYVSNNVLKQMSNRDLIDFDEKYIKAIMFSQLVSTGAYTPVSEREVEKGYIDIYLPRDKRMPNVKYEWIIELKYIKESQRGKLKQVKQDGLKQLERYATSRDVVGREDIKKALIVVVGKGECFVVEN